MSNNTMHGPGYLAEKDGALAAVCHANGLGDQYDGGEYLIPQEVGFGLTAGALALLQELSAAETPANEITIKENY